MLDQDRGAEVEKYEAAYLEDYYRMGDARKAYAEENIASAKDCKTHLDVGCGRGEMVDFAESIGLKSQGVEAVDYLADRANIIHGFAWDLRFDNNSVDLVTMFDVIEHVLPEDTERTLNELKRVAKKQLFITAANYSSFHDGQELHINKRPYEEWDALFRQIFHDATVTWLPLKYGIGSETWRIKVCPCQK
ncbi:MAG: hypothetical protein COB36_10705 [Alphaproteobacteria bacterium]|nr:MAG: hypothetical protein COB36_10705 [Alphaproteobacteria bacterium]